MCTDARRDRGDFADFVDAAFAGGVDIIQLRDKSLEAAEELELLEVLHAAAPRHGRLWAVNDRADIASLSGAPVFHIGQKDISLDAARGFLGKDTVIGLSTHSPEQVDAAIAVLARAQGTRLLLRGTRVGHSHETRTGRRRPRPGALRRRGDRAGPGARCRGSRSAASTSAMWRRSSTPAPGGSLWSGPSPTPMIQPTPPAHCWRHWTPLIPDHASRQG